LFLWGHKTFLPGASGKFDYPADNAEQFAEVSGVSSSATAEHEGRGKTSFEKLKENLLSGGGIGQPLIY